MSSEVSSDSPLGTWAASMVSSGDWMKGGEVSRLRRRYAMPRRKTSKACVNCKKIKMRCDDTRPCKRCVKRNCEATCADEVGPEQDEGDVVHVALPHEEQPFRPISTKLAVMLDESTQQSVKADVVLPFKVCKILWMMGMHDRLLWNIFLNLPPDLYAAAAPALSALDVIFEHTQRAPSPPKKENGRPQIPFEKAELEIPGTALMCLWLDQEKMIRQGCALNRFANMLSGVHPEEHLARVANHDVPSPWSEVDTFCFIMDDFLNMQQQRSTRYTYWRRGFMKDGNSTSFSSTPAKDQSFGHLIKWTRVNNVEDPLKSMMNATCYWEVITPEQYDLAIEENPDAVRPLSAVMGDVRSGSQILAGYDHELDSWASLMSSPQGRVRIALLAEGIRTRFAPLLAIAEAMKSGMADPSMMMGPTAKAAVKGGEQSAAPCAAPLRSQFSSFETRSPSSATNSEPGSGHTSPGPVPVPRISSWSPGSHESAPSPPAYAPYAFDSRTGFAEPQCF